MTFPKHPMVSHLAHVELYTPNLEASTWFFRDVLGLAVVDTVGDSVYLRGFGDAYHHSLKLTGSDQAGLGHAGWRASDPEALDLIAESVEKSGLGTGWTEGDRGYGKAYSFTTPDGHRLQVLWDVDKFQAPAELRPSMPSRSQRYISRGAAVRRIDHVTLLASSVEENRKFNEEHLGFRHREGIFSDDGEQEIGAWLAVSNLSHDTAYLLDGQQAKGRLHHVAFALDTREEVLRAADVLKDAGLTIELGPTRHSLSEAFFLYVREPGGNRVEIYNSGAGLRFAPDWGPVKWKLSERPTFFWPNNETMPETMRYGTPLINEGDGPNAHVGPDTVFAPFSELH